ncbi:hypothetical protein FKM82_018294 [Ascaphus truei]
MFLHVQVITCIHVVFIPVPDVINNMNIDNITTNSVFLSWTHPAGNRSSYGIEFLGIPSKNLTVYSESVLVDQLVPGNFYTFSIFAIAGNGLTGNTTVNSTFTGMSENRKVHRHVT